MVGEANSTKLLLAHLVEGQVQLQNIHARLAQEAQIASRGVLRNQAANLLLRHPRALATRGAW